ncbi:MAG: tRNA uridine-5-carboxymethylaminomethyl(34) synthesis GTPase MnmE [Treponema sp.]|nr:tRNA uridine-5-carboxymethylaminomethyl(34) synthesis GTPase MnmE [Treponema sp.]
MDTTGYAPEEPIAAIATSLAPAALGIIRASGKSTIELVSKIFSRPEALKSAQGNSIVYGWIVEPSKNDIPIPGMGIGKKSVEKIDEVLISVFRAPKSFTGEEMAEISCHGGTAIIMKIFNLLLQNGFRKAERGEFTFRAYINGKTDLTKAEAVREIIESRTNVSSQKAAGRLAGNLFKEISRIKKLLVETLAQIEVEIEYPEDEETIADAFDKEKLFEAKRALEIFNASWRSEKLFQEGARIVLCGKTNAGKSSLFNALLKEERAIVSDLEGTTRDWIESWISIDGIPARLFDTAGLRQTSDKVELRGLEATRELSADADLILYLADNSLVEGKIDFEFIRARNEKIIFVWNKIDKTNSQKRISLSDEDKSKIKNFCGEVFVSAKNGEGIKDLIQKIKSVLLGGAQTERTQAGLGSARQKHLVQNALENVSHALLVSEDFSLDAVVQDLEDALDALGEITGEVTSDDILENIFANFCVGK